MNNVFSFEYVYNTLSRFYNSLLDFFVFSFEPFYVGLSEDLQAIGFTSEIADAYELFIKNFLGDITFGGLVFGFLVIYCIVVVIRWFIAMFPALPPGIVPK